MNRVLAMHLNGLFQETFLVFFKTDTDRNFDLHAQCHIYDSSGVHTFFSKIGLKCIDTFLSELKLLSFVCTLIKNEGISVVTADEPFVTGLNACCISFLTGKPFVIYNLADFDLFFKIGGHRNIPFVPRCIERTLERFVLHNASMVITDRDFYRAYVLKRGARPQRCCSTRVTTDAFYYTASCEPGFRKEPAWEGKKILFYFGRLHPEKKTDHLIRCLAHITETRSDVVLIVAGEGAQLDELKKLSASLDVAENVFFLGNRNNQELVNLMSVSDILLATHAGYSLLEMALSGKPIIAFDYEWHSEFIENNVTGILVPDADSIAMAQAAVRLLSDSAISKQIGETAKEKARSFYNYPDALADEEKCFKRLLKVETK
ncbi:MAG TPA: glycosyltransferase [Candidatus Omnitrophota bacterium]|nr:glycosyltransferase [Candidatus Omnitrophota bacterium]